MKIAIIIIVAFFVACSDVHALIVGEENHSAANEKQPTTRANNGLLPLFNYWNHVGTVGMGTGIYLGEGYVLTSAHVGCYPFCLSDGSHYKPNYASWSVLSNAGGIKGDLAVFRVDIGDSNSSLAKLESLTIGDVQEDKNVPLLMIGTGYGQQPSGSGHVAQPNLFGYNIKKQRQKKWGLNQLDEILKQPVSTSGGYQTQCFVTTFDKSQGSTQATDGDSGGAMFSYNTAQSRWELVGCIIAVSQIGSYVPFGSRTYMGVLSSYRDQLIHSKPQNASTSVAPTSGPIMGDCQVKSGW